MERERLTRLVEEPGSVVRGDLADLHALSAKYPWFAGAQVLRSLGEQQVGDVRSEETLRSAAVHVPSRGVLFDLVARKDPIAGPSLTVVPSHFPVEVAEIAPISVSSSPDRFIAPDTLEASSKESEADLPAIPEDTPTPEADPLELQIMEAALANAYDLTWASGIPDRVPETPRSRPEPTIEVPPIAHEDIVPEGVAPVQERTPVTVPATSVNVRKARLSFTDWLDQGVGSEVEPPLPATPSSAPTTKDLNLPAAPSQSLTPKEPTDTKDLVDQFIQQQNPAPGHKVGFYTPQQAAKRSLDDTAGLVTETLARVYVAQGNLTKAIDAYRRLALKYPAKSAYFAALSKELEGQLNT